jgi:HK97 family phage prohead protease
MNRAYATFEVKELDDDKRILTGIATTPTPDRMEDIVEPKGAVFKLPIPLLWQHRHDQPIGNVTKATVKDSGIEVVAQLAKVDEPGTLKNRLDEAWQSIKAGLVRGFSIGFSSIEHASLDDSRWGVRYIKWEWHELSAVTIPANAEATIQSIKSMDEAIRRGRGIKLISAREGHIRSGAVELIHR